MDMFTDVDVFADILDAAMRNVAVYLILDEQNAHHFVNMVSNCRVNLQNIQVSTAYTLEFPPFSSNAAVPCSHTTHPPKVFFQSY